MSHIFYLLAVIASFFTGDPEQETTKPNKDNTEKYTAFYHS